MLELNEAAVHKMVVTTTQKGVETFRVNGRLFSEQKTGTKSIQGLSIHN